MLFVMFPNYKDHMFLDFYQLFLVFKISFYPIYQVSFMFTENWCTFLSLR